MMFQIFRDLRALVALANSIAAQPHNPGDAPRWSVFFMNRSFVVMAVAFLLNIAAVAGVPLASWLGDVAPEIIAGHIVAAVTLVLAIWAGIERIRGKTRVIWNKRQALKAVEEAHAPNVIPTDPLAAALRGAGATAVDVR